MRKYIDKLHHRETGFTLIELLIVVGILGILAAVAVVGSMGSTGGAQTAAYAVELRDIQLAVSVMLSESQTGQLDASHSDIEDMDEVTAESGTLVLSSYLTKLGADGTVLTGCTYSFTIDGTVSQETE
ncbi:type II secretion system protein [Chloroflexota bacterium]